MYNTCLSVTGTWDIRQPTDQICYMEKREGCLLLQSITVRVNGGGGGVLIIQFIRVGKILNYLRPSTGIWDLVHNSVRQSFENSELNL